MYRIGFISCLIITIAFSYCTDNKKNSSDDREVAYLTKYDSIKAQYGFKKISTDTTLLRFAFGMSEREFYKRMGELIDSNIISKTEDDRYLYRIVTRYSTEMPCIIGVKFDTAGLYSIRLIADLSSETIFSSPIIAATVFEEALTKKYGPYTTIYKVGGTYKRVWLFNDLEIAINNNDVTCFTSYTKISAEKSANEILEAEKKKKADLNQKNL